VEHQAATVREVFSASSIQRHQIRSCPLATCDMPLRVDGHAHDVISSQQPVERWQGADSCPRYACGTSRISIRVCVLMRSKPSNHAHSSRRRYGLHQLVSAGQRFNFLRAARTLPSTVSLHGPAVFMSGEIVPPWHLTARFETTTTPP